MARRRKRNDAVILYVLLFVALVVLTVIAISNPWSILSLLFILTLVILCFVGASVLWGNIQTKTERVKRYRYAQHVHSKGDFDFMTPFEFEKYVATLYENLGYTAEVTKQSGDEGIDIILKNKEGAAAVQVKRYTKGNVGRPEVQRLVGASLHKFDKMFFVTSSGYTNEARNYAEHHGVDLVDADGLAAMSAKIFGSNYLKKIQSNTILERTGS